MATRKRSPYLSQAQARSVVRFQPEIDALVALLQQSHDVFHQSVQAAKGAAAYTQSAIAEARPAIRSAYHVPGLNPAQAVAAPDLPAAGALDFKSASQFETQAAQHRIVQSRADALAGLEQQRIAAGAGAQYATQAARQTYLHDVGSVDQRLVQLAGQKGAYVVDQLGTLQQQAYDRALRRRQQNISRANAQLSHQDRAASLAETERHHQAQEQAATRRGQGFKLATPAAHGAASDAISYAERQARTLTASGRSRSEVADLLVKGRPATKILDPQRYAAAKQQHPDWTDAQQRAVATLTAPAIKAMPAVFVGAALDLVGQGYLSRQRVKRLHTRGLSVRKLGLPTHRSHRLDQFPH